MPSVVIDLCLVSCRPKGWSASRIVSSVSTRHKLETHRERSLLEEMPLWVPAVWCFFTISDQWGGPSPLWVVPSLGGWSWVLWKSKLSKPWESKSVSRVPPWPLQQLSPPDSNSTWFPFLAFSNDGTWSESVGQINIFLPNMPFGWDGSDAESS